jgi:plasmid stability protein
MTRAVNFRLDEGLVGRLKVRCVEDGVSQAEFVRRALESALATEAGSGDDARVSPARLPASSRATVTRVPGLKTGRDVMLERQVRLNKQLGH